MTTQNNDFLYVYKFFHGGPGMPRDVQRRPRHLEIQCPLKSALSIAPGQPTRTTNGLPLFFFQLRLSQALPL